MADTERLLLAVPETCEESEVERGSGSGSASGSESEGGLEERAASASALASVSVSLGLWNYDQNSVGESAAATAIVNASIGGGRSVRLWDFFWATSAPSLPASSTTVSVASAVKSGAREQRRRFAQVGSASTLTTLTLTALALLLCWSQSHHFSFSRGATTEGVVGFAAAPDSATTGTGPGPGTAANEEEEAVEDSSGGLYREEAAYEAEPSLGSSPASSSSSSSSSSSGFLHASEQHTPPPRSASLTNLPASNGKAADEWNLEEDDQVSSEKISVSGVSGSNTFKSLLSSVEHTISSALGSREDDSSDDRGRDEDQEKASKEEKDGPCNSTDFKLWDEISSDTFHEQMNTCGRSCWGDAGCVAGCVAKTMGYSESCSSCFSILSKCAMAHCMWQCVGGEGTACRECGREHCRPPFARCTGFPGRPGPDA